MTRYAKSRAARADHDSFYQPSLMTALLALAVAFLLLWHGMARAADFAPSEDDSAQSSTISAEPLDSGCTDNMDFSPEANLPSPFDADSTAFHQVQTPLPGLYPAALDDSCHAPGLQPQQV